MATAKSDGRKGGHRKGGGFPTSSTMASSDLRSSAPPVGRRRAGGPAASGEDVRCHGESLGLGEGRRPVRVQTFLPQRPSQRIRGATLSDKGRGGVDGGVVVVATGGQWSWGARSIPGGGGKFSRRSAAVACHVGEASWRQNRSPLGVAEGATARSWRQRGVARSRADVAGTSIDARRRPRRLPLPRGAAGGHRSGVALDASCQGGGGFLHGRGLRGATNGCGGLGAWRGADKTGVTHLREWPRLPAAAQGVSVPTYRRVSALTRRHDDCLNTKTHTPSRCFVLCKAAPATHQTVLAGSSEAMPRLFTHKRAKYMAKKLLRARRPPATDCPPPRLEHTSQIRSVPLVEAHPVSCLQRGRRRVHIEMRGTGLSHFDI